MKRSFCFGVFICLPEFQRILEKLLKRQGRFESGGAAQRLFTFVSYCVYFINSKTSKYFSTFIYEEASTASSMSLRCSVQGCPGTKNEQNQPVTSLHQFPVKPNLAEKWLDKLGEE
jgi:hypothetical protein